MKWGKKVDSKEDCQSLSVADTALQGAFGLSIEWIPFSF